MSLLDNVNSSRACEYACINEVFKHMFSVYLLNNATVNNDS